MDERPRLSASIAHVLVSRSPLHAWTASRQLNPDAERVEDTKFDIGNVVHELVLAGETRAVVGEWSEYRTDASKAWRDGVRESGQIPLKPQDAERVFAMVARIREQLGAFDVEIPLLDDGVHEAALEWDEAGVLCKARLDWLRNDGRAIDDLKTTSRSASPPAYARRLYDNGGDLQAAFYVRAVEQAGGTPEFRWIVCETEPPFCVSVIEPGPDVLALGAAKVDLALALWRKCVESGEWPGYPPIVHRAELPPWEESRFLERMESL